jgi:hypothetical protein
LRIDHELPALWVNASDKEFTVTGYVAGRIRDAARVKSSVDIYCLAGGT